MKSTNPTHLSQSSGLNTSLQASTGVSRCCYAGFGFADPHNLKSKEALKSARKLAQKELCKHAWLAAITLYIDLRKFIFITHEALVPYSPFLVPGLQDIDRLYRQCCASLGRTQQQNGPHFWTVQRETRLMRPRQASTPKRQEQNREKQG